MKLAAALSILLFGVTSSALANTNLRRETTLANDPDFLLISDIEEAETRLFLSYTGRQFNHCGIALRSHSFSASAIALHGALDIVVAMGDRESAPVGEIDGGRLVAKVDPDLSTYGRFFKIKTKSGQSLTSVIRGLNEHVRTEVIVEILPCE